MIGGATLGGAILGVVLLLYVLGDRMKPISCTDWLMLAVMLTCEGGALVLSVFYRDAGTAALLGASFLLLLAFCWINRSRTWRNPDDPT